MIKAVYFDLDGTLADLYSVRGWLPQLQAEDVTPYEQAAPMVDPEELVPLLQEIANAGVTVGVISWGAIGGSNKYVRNTRRAKLDWCRKYYPDCFTEFHVVKYGRRPKWQTARTREQSVLFDDDEKNCNEWRNGEAVHVHEAEDILTYLRQVVSILKEAFDD